MWSLVKNDRHPQMLGLHEMSRNIPNGSNFKWTRRSVLTCMERHLPLLYNILIFTKTCSHACLLVGYALYEFYDWATYSLVAPTSRKSQKASVYKFCGASNTFTKASSLLPKQAAILLPRCIMQPICTSISSFFLCVTHCTSATPQWSAMQNNGGKKRKTYLSSCACDHIDNFEIEWTEKVSQVWLILFILPKILSRCHV